MSFSSRRRNYLLSPHRRDGLIEWMKSMLTHSFVLDALETTGADTFSHFEVLIEEHRRLELENSERPSRLKTLVPTIGKFHTCLPLRQAFEVYNAKHCLTKRKHIQISFNEIRHIMNLAQVIALKKPCEGEGAAKEAMYIDVLAHASTRSVSSEIDPEEEEERDGITPGQLDGPRMITFDGDQTLYSDGSNFDNNPRLANYLCQLLRHGVFIAVVTAAGYEYEVEKYEFRLSGLLDYFKAKQLTEEECKRFFLFGGECNYLLHVSTKTHLDFVCYDFFAHELMTPLMISARFRL
jgi:IMP and pyridine-specific 5'-nucleotidase